MTTQELWIPGQPFEREVPSAIQLAEKWGEYAGTPADPLDSPDILAAFTPVSPEKKLSAVAAIDICGLLRPTSEAFRAAIGEDPEASGSFSDNTWAAAERVGLTRERSVVETVVNALMEEQAIPPIDGAETMADHLREWRARGVITFAITGTFESNEDPTVAFLKEHFAGCFDAVAFTYNHDPDSELKKAEAVDRITRAMGLDPDELPKLAIDDTPHHVQGYLEAFNGGKRPAASLLAGHPYNEGAFGNDVRSESPIQAFEAADVFLDRYRKQKWSLFHVPPRQGVDALHQHTQDLQEIYTKVSTEALRTWEDIIWNKVIPKLVDYTVEEHPTGFRVFRPGEKHPELNTILGSVRGHWWPEGGGIVERRGYEWASLGIPEAYADSPRFRGPDRIAMPGEPIRDGIIHTHDWDIVIRTLLGTQRDHQYELVSAPEDLRPEEYRRLGAFARFSVDYGNTELLLPTEEWYFAVPSKVTEIPQGKTYRLKPGEPHSTENEGSVLTLALVGDRVENRGPDVMIQGPYTPKRKARYQLTDDEKKEMMDEILRTA